MTIEQHRFDDRDAMLDALYQVFVGDIEQAFRAVGNQYKAELLLDRFPNKIQT